MKQNVINGIATISGENVNITIHSGSVTAQFSKENAYAIVTKSANQEKKDFQINSPSELISSELTAAMADFLDVNFDKFQTKIEEVI